VNAPPVTDRRIRGTARPPIPRPPTDERPPAVRPKWNLIERQRDAAQIAALERRVSELEMSIVKAKQAARALTLYGAPGTLDEAVAMVAASPKFADLNENEHRYVAMVALATGLHPEFQVHAFKSRGKLVITPDYKGLINLADSRYLMTKERRLTADEMRARGIPERDIAEGSIAYVVEGYELDKAALARQAGIEYEPLRGFGWWAAKKDEERWDDRQKKKVPTGRRIPNDVPNGRDGEWVAWKRATRALYYQLSDLTLKFNQPVPGASRGEEDEYVFDVDAPIIDGQTVDRAAPEPSTPAAPPAQPSLFEQPSLCTMPGCDQPGQVTPVGFLCPAHAHQKADAEAAAR
jgi:hypothetical protein